MEGVATHVRRIHGRLGGSFLFLQGEVKGIEIVAFGVEIATRLVIVIIVVFILFGATTFEESTFPVITVIVLDSSTVTCTAGSHLS
jgi:hypothetical protein